MKRRQFYFVILAIMASAVFSGCEGLAVLAHGPKPESSSFTYTVTFDINGGSGTTPSAQTVQSGFSITLPSGDGLSRTDGYIFSGWNTNSSGTGMSYNAGSLYPVTGNITLYAQWADASTVWTVKFETNGGSDVGDAVISKNTRVERPTPNPDRTGYTFDNWYNSEGLDTAYNFSSNVTGNITLYAKWNPITYTVAYNANGGTGTMASSSHTYDIEKSLTSNAFTRANDAFAGWARTPTGAVEFTDGQSVKNLTTTAGETITLYAVWRMAMVFVPGGTFQLGQKLGTGGDSDATPVSNVTLSGFYIGKYEVTQKQWKEVMGTTIQELQTAATGTDSVSYGRGDNYPVYFVSWYDALVFCNKLSMTEGLTPAYRIYNSTNPNDWGPVPTSTDSYWDAVTIVSGSTGYRLPTEAQWEYAAKGGDPLADGWAGYTFAGSDTADNVAWYEGNNGSSGAYNYGSKQAGIKASNGLDLYDMSGNVYEWCWDWFGAYTNEDKTDPTGPSSLSENFQRVVRGGCWHSPEVWEIDNSGGIGSVRRAGFSQYYRRNDYGFRLARPGP